MSDAESRINSILDAQEGITHEADDTGSDNTGQSGRTDLVPAGQSQQPTTRTTADRQSDAQPDQQGRAAQGQRPQSGARASDNGDLVDQQGNVVARAGRERRIYETQRAVDKATAPLQQELTRTRAELDAFRQAAHLPTQLGLAPQDVTTAMQFMSHWRRDPVGAARNMLAELRAAGYDLPDLGSGVDTAALQRMIQEAIAPFRQDREAQRQQAEHQTAVQREIADLYEDMPWARAQEQELIALLEADKNMSLRDAAYQLQIWALQRGYDFTKPLRPQHEAAMSAQQQPQAPQPQRNARVPGPPMNGAGNVVERRGSSVGHDRTTRDIVREAMVEAGLQVG